MRDSVQEDLFAHKVNAEVLAELIGTFCRDHLEDLAGRSGVDTDTLRRFTSASAPLSPDELQRVCREAIEMVGVTTEDDSQLH